MVLGKGSDWNRTVAIGLTRWTMWNLAFRPDSPRQPGPCMSGNWSPIRILSSHYIATRSTLGKHSVQSSPTYSIPVPTLSRLSFMDHDGLPWPLALREKLWECAAGVTVCNIEYQNEANFSYCMHSTNPHCSIIISTTVTITAITITTIPIITITITTITITTIAITTITIITFITTRVGYFTLWLFICEHYIPPRYQRSLIHHSLRTPCKATFTPTSEAQSTAIGLLPAKPVSPLPVKPAPPLPAKLVSPLPAKPDPPLPACSQQHQIFREVRARIPLLPACSQPSQIVREVRVSIPPPPAYSQPSQIHCYWRSQSHPYQQSHIHCYQQS